VTAFDNVLDRLSVDWGVADVVLFGEQPGDVSLYTATLLSRDVHEPASYTRLQNPDYCLVQALDSLRAGGVVAYITDGVQSAAQFGNPSPTVRKLKEWLASGRGLEVVGFRSEFSGPAWSEQYQRWIGPADVADRPFYMFMFAHSHSELDDAVGQLSPSLLASAERLRFPDVPVACSVQIEAPTAYPAPSGAAYIFINAAVRHQFFATAPDTVALYSCVIDEGYPLAALTVENSVEYWHWDPANSAWVSASPPAAADFRSDISLGAQPGTAITALLPATTSGAPSRFGFYHIVLRPRPAGLRNSISALSTDSDADIANFGMTYRFDWLVEHLVRSHFDMATRSSSLFMTVQQDPR
jgi:hypothetical protein